MLPIPWDTNGSKCNSIFYYYKLILVFWITVNIFKINVATQNYIYKKTTIIENNG